MPKTIVKFYKENNGSVPVYEWLNDLKNKDRIGYARCVAKIHMLADMGLDARRPTVEYLENGIYELRIKHIHIQYRILYFFQNQEAIILAHNLIKKTNRVPQIDIDIAFERKTRFLTDSRRHTYEQEQNY